MSRARFSRLAVALSLAAASSLGVACRRARAPEPPPRIDVAALAQAAVESLRVTFSPTTGRPSFVRGRIPLAVIGLPAADTSATVIFTFMRRYAAMFGIDTAARDLRLLASQLDRLGMRHITVQQHVGGVEVYGAVYTIHIAPQGGGILAMTSSLVPNVRAATTTPTVTEDSARALARALLLGGQDAAARLVVYPGRARAADAALAWIVEVRGQEVKPDTTPGRDQNTQPDTVPARKDIVIDATRGRVLDLLDRLYIARNRQTHSANNGTTLPGTLRRTEAQGPVGDADVDSAHTFVGATYDYYSATHSRDSYDNSGATLVTTVHYGTNYENAFWNGVQMVFGDGFAVKDVTAHELTHAVTERTANLEYRWQSGALNESFSDIFGAMVDRDDWLMGEDMPIGAIRDLENPGAFGQPGHASGWVATCGDNEGVHTNSGIPNKAFVNIVTTIGKNDAERIFYRALTAGYLTPQASMEDARGAAIQSAQDLFGAASPQVQAVTNGFNAVGVDGTWQPPVNNCGLPIPTPADLSTIAALVLAALLAAAILRARRRAAARA
jgi:Zn-dependent metalloprotease